MKKTRKRYIIANWKMNPQSPAEARELFSKIKKTAHDVRKVQTVVCPPFVFLADLQNRVRSKKCVLGAQDIFWETRGAYTGEVSPRQVLNCGAEYVILGHSERRALGDTDEIVNKKVKAAFGEGLTVVLCVGEHARDPQGVYFNALREQIKNSLYKVSQRNIGNLIIAYEPIWAIGEHAQGADTPETLFEMTIFIKKVLSDIISKQCAMQTPILYGGSVNGQNTEGFLRDGGVQGLLVGRASLDPKIFSSILRVAAER